MEEQRIKTTPVKPVIMCHAEARHLLTDTVNRLLTQYALSPVNVESMLSEALYRVREITERDLQSAQATYSQQLTELQKQKQEETINGRIDHQANT